MPRGRDRDRGSSGKRVGGRGEGPALTPEGLREQAERRRREAAALRENLRRRKAQARARAKRRAEKKAGPGGRRGPQPG